GLFAGNAVADDGVIYRCTSSNSDVPTLQRTPCPAGSKQQVVRIPAAASASPTPTPVPSPPEPAAAGMPPASAPSPRRPGEGRTIMEAGMVEREGGDLILDSASL